MNSPEDDTQAIVTPKSRLSLVWLLPIVAAIIGAGMVYQHWQNRGMEIVIVFENAKSLEVKKTKLKFRNVDIGTVKAINFTDDGNSIEAKLTIDKSMQRFLRTDSQFWVVRPNIGSGGVTGFSTLLSGAYITIEPGKSEYYSDRFIGLEAPPISSPTTEGLKLKLASNGGKSLAVGNPILYRGFEVGAVETVEFDIESRKVSYGIFIAAPYDKLVTTNTHFWNSGGVAVTASSEGISVDIASLETLVSGGVQFDIPDDLGLGEHVTQSREFELYESKAAIKEGRVYEYLEYVILVDDSIGGLQKGAPVEYRGVRLGRVHNPYLGFYQSNQIDSEESRIPVVIHIEPARLAPNGEYDLAWFHSQFTQWIKDGLSASLETANYLTGALKVSLDISTTSVDEIESYGRYTVIPSSKSGFASIMNKTENLLHKLESLPLNELVSNANNVVQSANTAVLSANKAIADTQTLFLSVENTLKEVSLTLQGMQPSSPMYKKLEDNLQELERTLNMMQPVLQQIRSKPNSLVFSNEPPDDVQPKGKSQ